MEDDYVDSGDDLINGDGTTADYVQNTGGAASPYVTNQSVYDAADNGLITSTAATTTTASGTPTGTTGSSTSGIAGWLASIQALAGSAGTTATTLAPLINGQPSTTAVAAGTPANGTVGGTTANFSTLIIIGIVAVIAWMFLKRK